MLLRKKQQLLSLKKIERANAKFQELRNKKDIQLEVEKDAKSPTAQALADQLQSYHLYFDDKLHSSNFNRRMIDKVSQISGMDPILAEWEHVTGAEREQIEVELAGETIEDDLRGPFVTWEHPVIVPSYYHFRLVGCLGHEGKTQHELLWHEVKIGKPLICVECGQVFKLKRIPMPGNEDDPRYKEEEKGNYFVPKAGHH